MLDIPAIPLTTRAGRTGRLDDEEAEVSSAMFLIDRLDGSRTGREGPPPRTPGFLVAAAGMFIIVAAWKGVGRTGRPRPPSPREVNDGIMEDSVGTSVADCDLG